MPRRKRGSNEGSIFKLPDGRWRALINLGYRNGRRWRKPIEATTREEVQEKLIAALRDRQLGFNIAPERQKLGEFLQVWLKDVAKQNVRSSTLASYSWIIREHLVPGMGRLPLSKITAQQIQRFLNERLNSVRCPHCETRWASEEFRSHLSSQHPEKADADLRMPRPLAPRTVQHIHATLRVALQCAVRWGVVARNVATLVDAPRVPHPEMQPLNPDQARNFLEAMRGDRLEALYSVAMAIGLRQGEALGLRWNDIDLEAGTLTVSHALQRIGGKLQLVETKRQRSRRTITLPKVCVSALHVHRAHQEGERAAAGSKWQQTDFVFTTTVGTPLDGPTVTHRFQKALKLAGLQHMRFHDLRHTCATLLLAQGVHPRIVMEILGHSQISVTMNTYSHVIPVMQREVADRMNEILNPVATVVATGHASVRAN
jgi:integrase